MDSATVERACALYRRGKTWKQVGAELGCDGTTARKHALRAGVQSRCHNFGRGIALEDAERIEEMGRAGKRLHEIIKATGRDHKTVRRYLDLAGIEPTRARKKSQSPGA